MLSVTVKGLRKEKWVAARAQLKDTCKFGGLSMGPQTHLKVKGESQLHKGVLWLHMHSTACGHLRTIKNSFLKVI